MIIGTIRFLHLSPREGGAFKKHFGLSARHFSLAPAGYYRQQGTKTGRKPKRDWNQFGTGTNRDKEPSPPGTLRQKGTIRLGAATVARSRRPKIEVALRYTAASRQGNQRQREPISAIGTIGNRNHRQRGTRTPTASFLSLLESWTTSKLATVTTPKAICLTSSPVEHRKRR